MKFPVRLVATFAVDKEAYADCDIGKTVAAEVQRILRERYIDCRVSVVSTDPGADREHGAKPKRPAKQKSKARR